MSHLLKGGNFGKKIVNNSNASLAGDIVCANYLWFWGASLLPNIAVCLNYLLSVNDILDLASYNRDKFVLSVTIASKKKRSENVSVWLRKTFTERYWQLMKCLCKCCDIRTCQNYDNIRTANWKTKRLQRRCYLARKQLQDFLWMNLWSLVPCCFCNTVLQPNNNIQLFHRRKA